MEDSQNPSVISTVAQTETVKYLTQFVFSGLEKIAGTLNRDRQINESLDKLNLSSLEREKILNHIHDKYLKTRTISNTHRNIDIQNLYHPLTLKYINNDNQSLVIDNNTLPRNKITCIIGKAGQGKTTLLRKLYLNDIIRSENFPIIIFLRNLKFSEPLDAPEIICNEMATIGLEIPRDDWAFIMQSGKLNIYWDGFDEVPTEFRSRVVALIEATWTRFNCPCFVTTRPETEITRYGGSVTNITISDLNKDDIISIITKTIGQDIEYLAILKSAIENSDQLAKCLVTPIIVDIFIYTYKSLKSDPTSIVDFYSELFICLARQHDKLKLYEREVLSGLSAKELERAFRHASFQLLTSKKTTFSEQEIEKAFSASCKALGFEDPRHQAHLDVINITNLITPDGYGTYSFIHKSILEFYAAQYIAELPDTNKEMFFEQIITRANESFLNTLKFFQEINNEEFNVYFLDKFNCKVLKPLLSNPINTFELFTKMELVKIAIDSDTHATSIFKSHKILNNNVDTLFKIANSKASSELFSLLIKIKKSLSNNTHKIEFIKDNIDYFCIDHTEEENTIEEITFKLSSYIRLSDLYFETNFTKSISDILNRLFNEIQESTEKFKKVRSERVEISLLTP